MSNLSKEDTLALLYAFCYCLLVYAVGQIFKSFLVSIFESLNESDRFKYTRTVHTALQDGIAAFQACACSLENAVVRVTLGEPGLLVAMTIHGLLMIRFAWKNAYGSTCNVFYRYLKNHTNFVGLCLSWMCQLGGAFVALHLSYAWWSTSITTHHASLYSRKLFILKTLQQERNALDSNSGVLLEDFGDLRVSPILGGLVEAGTVCFDILLGGVLTTLFDAWRFRHESSRLENVFLHEAILFTVRQSAGIYVIHLGLPLTGSYVNGVNAVIQTWGLGKSRNALAHLFVYWLCPFLGAWIGLLLVDRISSSNTATVMPAVHLNAFKVPNSDLSEVSSVPTSSRVGGNLQLAASQALPTISRSQSLTCQLSPNRTSLQPRGADAGRRFSYAGFGDASRICHRHPIQNDFEDDDELDSEVVVMRHHHSQSLRNTKSTPA